jgi:phosphoribosylglycinamide formyltransferase-1
MKRLVILISGRGSNLAALLQAAARDGWQASIRVLSSRADAAGLQTAAQYQVPTEVIEAKAFGSREAFDQALGDRLDEIRPDLIVLAGFMRILGPECCDRFSGRMVNIHPSLLPLLPGLDTHQRAIDSGLSRHGCTVHYVTAALDQGPILGQAEVPVLADDTAETLAARVLAMEHQLYPSVIAALLAGASNPAIRFFHPLICSDSNNSSS